MSFLKNKKNTIIIKTNDYEKISAFAYENGIEYDEENKKYINKPFLGLIYC